MSVRRALLVALAVFACLALPGVAIAVRRGASATVVYLRAEQTLLKAFATELPVAQTDANNYVSQVTAECPGVLSHAPLNQGFQSLYQEVVLGLAVAFIHPYDTPVAMFARRVEHLRWTSRALTKLVHFRAAANRAEAKIAEPHVCTDLSVWVASGYRTIPTATKTLERESEARSEERVLRNKKESRTLAEEILRLLRPYEHARTKALARSVEASWALTRHMFLGALEGLVSRLNDGLGTGADGHAASRTAAAPQRHASCAVCGFPKLAASPALLGLHASPIVTCSCHRQMPGGPTWSK